VALHPLAAARQFAVRHQRQRPARQRRLLLRSRDHGKTWENAKLPGPIESTVWHATHAADPMLIFCCTNLGELFRSTDGGESWTRLPHLFGELRALHWRALPAGTRRAAHR
jgi:photosystem II stability/assembly factor-like uncharacterized protein